MFFKKHGILGINARNLLYIRPYNKKKAIKLADNKLRTKHFLSARGIPVPKLFGVIKHKEEAENFDYNCLPSNFVIKPNFGFGGEGIIPITGKKDKKWIQANGKSLKRENISDHIIDIIDGRFSLSNIRDTAFFEQLITTDDILAQFCHKGLPDIRVVVHNLIPVMAMLRLPTRESGGKANLHQGAIGVGIDIAKGEATYCSYKNKIIDQVPEKGKIRGLKIPYWEDILFIASKTQLITNLGYMAVDIAIDRVVGPIILEINARAGLGVQIANLAPLRKRLERIEGIKVTNPTKGVRVAKDLFGNIIEKEITNVTGKQVIGLQETASIILKDQTFKTLASCDTHNLRSKIDKGFAREIGLLEDSSYDEDKSTVKIKVSVGGSRIQTVVDLSETINSNKPDSSVQLILGSRDLKNFIIDPSKTYTKTQLPGTKNTESTGNNTITTTSKKLNFAEINRRLVEIDKQIKLLYHLKPTNLEEEKAKFLKNPRYNPQFTYQEPKFDSYALARKLDQVELDQTPLGKLFQTKKEEIEQKIALIEHRGTPLFTEISIDLYGNPSFEEYQYATNRLKEIAYHPEYQPQTTEKTFSAEEAQKHFNQAFKDYGLINWKAKIKESMVADCLAGKDNSLFIRNGAQFTANRLKNLVIHEIETHILSAENGKQQPYNLFQRGFGNYLITQEGLAVYNTIQQGADQKINEKRGLMTLLTVSATLLKSFVEVAALAKRFNVSDERAFSLALKVKRGLEDTSMKGGFTKGYVYWKGLKEVEAFIENGGNLKDLYFGKYNLNSLSEIKNIPNLIEPKYLPRWLNN